MIPARLHDSAGGGGGVAGIIGAPSRGGSNSRIPRRREHLSDHLRRRHRHEFKVDQVPPLQDPALEHDRVVALHELEAAVEVGLDPAIDVTQTVRHHSPLLAEAGVNGGGVTISEPFDDHEQHVVSYCGGSAKLSSLLFASGSLCRRLTVKMPKPTTTAVTAAPSPARSTGFAKSFVVSAMIQARPRPHNAIQAHASTGIMLTISAVFRFRWTRVS